MAGGEQIGGNADRAVFAGAVGGGDCGGGEGVIEVNTIFSIFTISQKTSIDYWIKNEKTFRKM